MSVKTILKRQFFLQTQQNHTGLFRPSSLPFLSGDTLRQYSDHTFDETKTLNPLSVKKNDIVFLKTDLIELYFSYYHKKINNPYILITHNSDKGVGHKEARFLDDKIIHWFSCNLEIKSSDRLSPIPIGLENRRFLSNGRIKNFKFIQSKKKVDKSDTIFSSFSLHTNFLVRNLVKKRIENSKVVYFSKHTKQIDYINELNNHKFILCPEGNNYDTHRVWEGLLLDVLPIVKNNSLNNNFFSLGIPMILIDDWGSLEVNSSKFYLEFHDKYENHDFKKFAEFNYWKKLINSKKI
jgi:hypothetical protein